MRPNVVTASPDAPASELADRMREHSVGSVVVVEDGRPVGIVTDRDLSVGPFAAGDDPDETPARDVMTPDPETVTEDAGLMDVSERLCEAGVRRLPVVGDDGSLSGIVTLDDMAVLLTAELTDLAGVIQAESPPY
jgi:CBS domain-containing protein